MKQSVIAVLAGLLVGCGDADKLARLEAENQQLKAQIQQAAAERPPVDLVKLQNFG